MIWGFLKRNQPEYIHPSPKSSRSWIKILSEMKPRNVLDIFHGSGCLAESAESLGIPWLAFEKKIKYKIDIDKRIKIGINRRINSNNNLF